MCLLTDVNSSLGNISFERKIPTFDDSELFLTNMLVGVDEWNRDEIQNRQNALADLAVSTWTFVAE